MSGSGTCMSALYARLIVCSLVLSALLPPFDVAVPPAPDLLELPPQLASASAAATTTTSAAIPRALGFRPEACAR